MDMKYVYYLPIFRPVRNMEKIVDTSKIVYLGDKSIFVFIIQQYNILNQNISTYTSQAYYVPTTYFMSLFRLDQFQFPPSSLVSWFLIS